jgi:hypothetical protein
MAVAGFIVGSVPAMTGRDPKSFPILSILGFFATALISSPFVWFAIKRRALRKSPPPVQFRRYVRNQNVTFRFRRPEYTTELLQFLESRPEAIHQQPPI